MPGPMLIYDGDCAFCQRCVDLAGRTLSSPVRCEPYRRVDLEAVGLTLRQAQSAVWWVDTDRLLRGHEAIAAVLRAQPDRGRRAVGWLVGHPPGSWIAAPVYALVARFRHLLPGGSAQCRPPTPSDPSRNQR